MKEVYIVLTHTGTTLSRIIKWFTKDEFSHVSISLDLELNEMYSFGRLNPYNPFLAGFVHEYLNKGTFKRFYKTQAKIYSLEVTDDQYEDLKNSIIRFEHKREEYTFNIIGLLAVAIHVKIKKENSFYCAEFVKYVMEKSNIYTGLPEIVRPENFKKIIGMQEIYKGLLQKYHSRETNISELIVKGAWERIKWILYKNRSYKNARTC